MPNKKLTFPESTVRRLGLIPGQKYQVEAETTPNSRGTENLLITYHNAITGALNSLPLGLNADTQGFQEGDTVEFVTKIKPLRLADWQMRKLGVEVGQKFEVKADTTETPGLRPKCYIEIGNAKVYLSTFADFIDETPKGEILTVLGYWDKE